MFWLGASKYHFVILTKKKKRMEVKYNCCSPGEESYYLQGILAHQDSWKILLLVRKYVN